MRKLKFFFILVLSFVLLIPLQTLNTYANDNGKIDIIMLLDNSHSLVDDENDNILENSRMAAAEFLRKLPQNVDHVAVYTFNSDPTLVYGMTDSSNIEDIINTVYDSIDPNQTAGGTDFGLVLDEAMKQFDFNDGNQHIVLLFTDGENDPTKESNKESETKISNSIELAKEKGVLIYTIGFGKLFENEDSQGYQTLQKIASLEDTFVVASNNEELDCQFDTILNNIYHSQYLDRKENISVEDPFTFTVNENAKNAKIIINYVSNGPQESSVVGSLSKKIYNNTTHEEFDGEVEYEEGRFIINLEDIPKGEYSLELYKANLEKNLNCSITNVIYQDNYSYSLDIENKQDLALNEPCKMSITIVDENGLSLTSELLKNNLRGYALVTDLTSHEVIDKKDLSQDNDELNVEFTFTKRHQYEITYLVYNDTLTISQTQKVDFSNMTYQMNSESEKFDISKIQSEFDLNNITDIKNLKSSDESIIKVNDLGKEKYELVAGDKTGKVELVATCIDEEGKEVVLKLNFENKYDRSLIKENKLHDRNMKIAAAAFVVAIALMIYGIVLYRRYHHHYMINIVKIMKNGQLIYPKEGKSYDKNAYKEGVYTLNNWIDKNQDIYNRLAENSKETFIDATYHFYLYKGYIIYDRFPFGEKINPNIGNNRGPAGDIGHAYNKKENLEIWFYAIPKK